MFVDDASSCGKDVPWDAKQGKRLECNRRRTRARKFRVHRFGSFIASNPLMTLRVATVLLLVYFSLESKESQFACVPCVLPTNHQDVLFHSLLPNLP